LTRRRREKTGSGKRGEGISLPRRIKRGGEGKKKSEAGRAFIISSISLGRRLNRKGRGGTEKKK